MFSLNAFSLYIYSYISPCSFSFSRSFLYNIQSYSLVEKCYSCFWASYVGLIHFQFEVFLIQVIISEFSETGSLCELGLALLLFCSVNSLVWRFHRRSDFLKIRCPHLICRNFESCVRWLHAPSYVSHIDDMFAGGGRRTPF